MTQGHGQLIQTKKGKRRHLDVFPKHFENQFSHAKISQDTLENLRR